METVERETAEKAYWDRYYGGMEKYLALPVHAEIARFLVAVYAPVGQLILDLGGGPGLHAKLLQKLCGGQVINIDDSLYAMSFLSHEVVSVKFDLAKKDWASLRTDLRVAHKVFADFAFSIQAFEHLPTDRIPFVFEQVHYLLEPHAPFFCSVAREDNTTDETHLTLEPISWWYKIALWNGFEHDVGRERYAEQISDLPKRLGWQCLYLRRDS